MNTLNKHFRLYLAVLFPLSLITSNLPAQTAEGWQASKEIVERLSKSGSEINYYEEKVPAYTLPDVLATTNGRKVSASRAME